MLKAGASGRRERSRKVALFWRVMKEPCHHTTLALVILMPLAFGYGCACSPNTPEPAPVAAPEPTPLVVEPPAIEPVDVQGDAALRRWLREQQVREGSWARRVLYTWTRAEQVAALSRGAPTGRARFLNRERAEDGRLSRFDQDIARLNDPLARLLRRRGHRARRFAWPTPWATRAGWGQGADYGDRLVRVELRTTAWVARYDAASTPRFTAQTLAGGPVSEAALSREPERVAAIYRVSRGTSEEGRSRMFREYVLVNEAMIERVQVGAPEMATLLMRDQIMLRRLAARFSERRPTVPAGPAWGERLGGIWRAPIIPESWTGVYEAAVAFESEAYLPTGPSLQSVADQLSLPPQEQLDYHPPEVIPHDSPRRPRRVRPRPTKRPRRFDPTLG